MALGLSPVHLTASELSVYFVYFPYKAVKLEITDLGHTLAPKHTVGVQ